MHVCSHVTRTLKLDDLLRGLVVSQIHHSLDERYGRLVSEVSDKAGKLYGMLSPVDRKMMDGLSLAGGLVEIGLEVC